jgi:ribose transport system ATP-binding protein
MSTAAVLELSGVSKSFDEIRVLDDVALAVRPGEILGLIGENGSGKSTLVKILSGYPAADPGAAISVAGEDVTGSLGGGARRSGMAFIHQDLALVPSMTVLENLRIARFRTGLGWRIRWREEREAVRSVLEQVGLSVDPDAVVADLSVTEQALVAVARGLADIEGEAGEQVRQRLLVLDEPTAYLPGDGVERLFGVLRDLTAKGAAIVFVSHRLDEVRVLCHRVAVLRGGVLVADEEMNGKNERDLLELMLGRKVDDLYPDTQDPEGVALLSVEGLAGGLLERLSFSARPGEIVGFAGLPGSGYEEVPYLLTGARRASGGRVRLGGIEVAVSDLHPRRAIGMGMVLLPADRARAGVAPNLTVRENMTLPHLRRYTRMRGVITQRGERRDVLREAERFGVTPKAPESALRFLSGGNQQKVVLAKWMLGSPQVLALHEPTQGVDVGAKRDIFAHLSTAAADGAAVLIASVEHEDLARLCTRVLVLREGRVARVIEQQDLSPGRLAEAVYGA